MNDLELPEARTDLACPDCGTAMLLRDGRFGPWYACPRYPECDGAHGAHPDGSPKGIPASRPVRQARIRAHEAFDRLWKDADRIYEIEETGPARQKVERRIRHVARGRAYRWLEDQLGLEASQSHMGSMGAEDCERVIEACEGVTAAEVRAWWKARGTQP